jgi:tetratricopeptide (TPR) repeat protein
LAQKVQGQVKDIMTETLIDYYEEFNLDRGSNLTDLLKNLRIQRQRISNRGDEQARARLNIIDRALADLKDDNSRKRYDLKLATWKQPQKSQEKDWAAQARIYFESKDYDFALEAIEKAISKDNENGKLYLLAAQICHEEFERQARGHRENIKTRFDDVSGLVRKSIEYSNKAVLHGEEENPNVYMVRACAFLFSENYPEVEKNTIRIRKF